MTTIYTPPELRLAIDYEVERIKGQYEPAEKLLDEYINDRGIVVAHPGSLTDKVGALIEYANTVVDENGGIDDFINRVVQERDGWKRKFEITEQERKRLWNQLDIVVSTSASLADAQTEVPEQLRDELDQLRLLARRVNNALVPLDAPAWWGKNLGTIVEEFAIRYAAMQQELEDR